MPKLERLFRLTAGLTLRRRIGNQNQPVRTVWCGQERRQCFNKTINCLYMSIVLCQRISNVPLILMAAIPQLNIEIDGSRFDCLFCGACFMVQRLGSIVMQTKRKL